MVSISFWGIGLAFWCRIFIGNTLANNFFGGNIPQLS